MYISMSMVLSTGPIVQYICRHYGSWAGQMTLNAILTTYHATGKP